MDPNVDEHALLEATLQRPVSRLTRPEVIWGGVSSLGLLGASAGVWTLDPPHAFAIAPALACLIVLVLSIRVRFYTPLGFASPVQLAFVPLMFALPGALVPVAVALGLALAVLPEVLGGSVRPSRSLLHMSNAWFSVGPVAVVAIAHVNPQHAGPALLLAALAAQFVIDFLVSSLAFAFTREAGLTSQLRETWIYVVDAALTPAALLAAESLHHTALAAVALAPLLGLLAVFANERQRRLEGTLELSNAYRGTALVLGDVVEADDGYTGLHCKSVVSLALEVAEQLRLSTDQRRNLEFGALLHDVGKIAIPKEIINKPGKLDPAEWEIIKTHTVEGQKMLDRVGGFMREVGLIIRSHHERWDGTGYPDRLAGERIPFEARIISCCDTWNAMRTDRPYRKALSHEAATAELLSVTGTQLDPTVVQTLLRIVAAETNEHVVVDLQEQRSRRVLSLVAGLQAPATD